MTGRRLLENDATLVQLCPAFFQPLSLTLSQTLTVSFYYVTRSDCEAAGDSFIACDVIKMQVFLSIDRIDLDIEIHQASCRTPQIDDPPSKSVLY